MTRGGAAGRLGHPISGRSPPVFLPRKLTEGCRLHGQVRASESSDTYAWAVMSVGPDALLFGESIIAMLGLAPTNPACSWQLLDEHGESFRIASKSNG